MIRVRSSAVRSRLSLVSLGRALAISVLVTSIASVLFVLLNYGVTAVDPEPLRAAIRRSFEHPTTTIEDSEDRFNDCLIAVMTLLRSDSRLRDAIATQRIYRRERPHRPCDALRELAYDGALSNQFLTVRYHNYWLGHRSVMRLLPLLGVEGLRTLLRVGSYGLLLLGLALALARSVSARTLPEALSREVRFVHFSFAALFLCLLLFFNLARRAHSLADGPANVVTFALLVVALLGSGSAGTVRARAAVAAAFGALMAYLALLFGTVLVGLLATLFVASLLPVAGNGGADRDGRRLDLLLQLGGSYLVGAVGAIALHLVFASVAFGDNLLFHFADQIGYRMTGDPRQLADPAIGFQSPAPVSLGRLLEHLHHHLGVLGFGSRALGLAVVSLAGLILVSALVLVVARWRSLADPWRWIGLLVSAAGVPGWYLVFFEHTQTHARVMVRLLAWPVAIAVVLAIAALLHRPAARATEAAKASPGFGLG